jgi:hypothetical protein
MTSSTCELQQIGVWDVGIMFVVFQCDCILCRSFHLISLAQEDAAQICTGKVMTITTILFHNNFDNGLGCRV